MRKIILVMLLVAALSLQTGATYLNSLNVAGTPVQNGNDITFSTSGSAKLRITLCYSDVVRFWVDTNGTFVKNPSFAVDSESWAPVSAVINDKGTYFQVVTSELSIRILKTGVKISIYKADDATLITDEKASGGIGWDVGGAVYSYWNLNAVEHIFGLGEDNTDTLGSLDRTGKTRTIWAQMNPRGGRTCSDFSIPFFMSTGNGSGGYGFFYDNSYITVFDMGKTSAQYYSWRATGGNIVFYFFNGPSFKKILGRYTGLTGTSPMPPLWTLGYLQSKCTYNNWNEINTVVNTMRSDSLPLDAMVLDYNWPSCYTSFQWSSSFAGGDTQVAALQKRGIRMVVSNSGPDMMSGCGQYADGISKGMFAKCGTGTCTAGWYNGQLLDPTAPGFQNWIWNSSQLQQLYQKGIAGWWLDLTEPENEPANTVYAGGASAKIHNVYSNLYCKAYYQGQIALAPNSRPVILTRCGSAGIQKYGASLWTGDIFSNYVTMQAHLPEAQSAGLSGISSWAMDCGGFQATNTTFGSTQYYKNDEYGAHALMYQRWFQFDCFVPVTRSHGVKDDEPYRFNASVTAGCKKYLQLRYRLLPYIYSYTWEHRNTGLPILRALVLEYQDDPNTYSRNLEYLFGREFLVAPVIAEYATTKDVYFPAGKWIDYDTGTVYSGGVSATVPAPQAKLPLFVKSGAIIPMAPLMYYTGQKKWDPITLDIYPDGTTQFTMYQDDGLTRDYTLSGKYTQTVFTSAYISSKQEIVTISESNKLFTPATYEYKIHLSGQITVPSPVTFNNVALNVYSSQTAYASASSGTWWDATAKVLWVRAVTSSATNYTLTVSLDGTPVSARDLRDAGVFPRSFDIKAVANNIDGLGASIQFMVPYEKTLVRIDMYDIAGRQVATLANGTFSAGYHTIMLNKIGNYKSGGSMWYLCRMKTTSGFEKTIKVISKI